MEKHDISETQLSNGQCIVRVRAIGLNFADVASVLGIYEAAPKGRFIPGLEFSGVVERIGPGVKSVQTGDRVMGVTRFGAYQSRLCIDERYLNKFPSDLWTFEEGAAFVVQAMTAWYALVELGALDRIGKRKSEDGSAPVRVLVHSVAGGVGMLAVQILNHFGAITVGTVGSHSKVDHLKQRETALTDETVIVRTRASEFGDQCRRALESTRTEQEQETNEKLGFDIVLDSLGGDYFQVGYDLMLPAGRLITFGAGSMIPSGSSPNWLKLAWQYLRRPKVDPLRMMGENKSVMGFNLIWLYENDRFMRAVFDEMLESVSWKPPLVGKVFPFDQLKEAVKYFQSGKSSGKVVISVDTEHH